MKTVVSPISSGPTAPAPGTPVMRLGAIAVLYFIVYEIAFLFPNSAGVIGSIWPASGVALAALLLSPRRQWPGLFAIFLTISLVANLIAGKSFLSLIGFGLANVAEPALGAWLITRWCGERVTFTRVTEVLGLIGAALLANGCTALIGAATATLASQVSFGEFYRIWWVSNGLGILLVAPLIVTWAKNANPFARGRVPRVLEATAVLTTALVLAWAYFGTERRDFPIVPHSYMLLAPLVWAAVRLGPRGATTTLAVLAVAEIGMTSKGIGLFPLGGDTATERVLWVQLYLGFKSIATLLLAASFTERKQAAAQLEAKTEELDRYFSLSPDLLCIADTDGHFLRLNSEWEKTLGYTRAELEGKQFIEFVHPDDVEATLAAVAHLREQKAVLDFQNRYRGKDGNYRWFEWRSYPQGKVVYAIARDITERRRGEQRISDALNFTDTMLAASPVGIVTFTADGRAVSANEAAARLIGATVDQLKAQNFRQLESWKRGGLLEAAERALKGGQEQQLDVHLMTTFGKEVWFSWRFVPFTYAGSPHLLALFADMAERRQAEAAIRGSEERLRASIENTPYVAVQWYDLDGRVQFWNPASERMFGYSSAEAMGRTLDQLIHTPEEAAQFRELLADIARTRKIVGPTEFSFRKRDGSTGRCVSTIFAIPGPQQGDYFVCMDVEVTLQRQAEAALRESEERYRTVVDLMPEGIVLSVDEKIAFVNAEALRMVGAGKSEELLGRSVYDFVPSEVHQAMKQRRSEVLQRGTIALPMETELLRMDGSRLLVEGVAAPISFLGKPAILNLVRDVTERRRTEQHLRLLAQTLKSAQDCISITDLDERILFINDAFLKVYGYAEDELMGKNITVVRGLSRPTESVARLYSDTVGGGWHGELMNRRKDGTEFSIELWTSLVRDPQGQPVALVGVARDISERKRLDEHLRQAQKMEAVGTLAGGIAHDFNNILGAIIGHAELARLSAKGQPEVTEALSGVLTASRRAKELVRQILAFSRQHKQERKPTRLQPVVKEDLKLLRSTVSTTIEIAVDIAEDAPVVLADATQVHQIVMNLGTNAAHAMRGRPGRLEVKLQRTVVDEVLANGHADLRPGEYARLTVTDNGHGMDEETLKRIFNPFFTTKEPGEGTGLGLSVVHGIVREHEGVITVKSQPERGTTFDVYFPAHTVAAAETSVEAPLPRSVSHEHILYVDDEAVLCRITQKMLVQLGYRATVETKPREALAKFTGAPHDFHMVILDLNMPEMTGLELAREIHALRPDIPIMLATGFSGEWTLDRLQNLGFRGVLHKPVEIAELSEALQRTLPPEAVHP